MKELLPYLPTDRRHAIANGIELQDRARGSALFVDISGFTPLAEGLVNDLGPQRGAEELTFFLNQVYNVLISDLDRCHGSVIGFSGDAITCWFDGDDGRAAAACAFSMQESMEQFDEVPLPSGERVSLAAKAGLAVGDARRFTVGETTQIDVLAGSLLDEMAEAEHHASRGEVVLGPSALGSLGDQIEIAKRPEEAEDFAIAAKLKREVEPDPWPELTADSLSDEQLRPWLLGPVYERLLAGQGEFLAELRPAVTLFLHFEGIDYDGDDQAGSKLDDFVQRVQRVVAKYGGTLIDITTGDKGSHFYLAFGAPTAHEDDQERAASAALDLRELVNEVHYISSVRMGMSRGRLRTGAYGGKTRRTYGVLGDATNLAARLMQAAGPGEILVSELAARRIEPAFTWNDRPAIKVKGKSETVAIKELVGRLSGQRQAGRAKQQLLPMVGREGELETLQSKLDGAINGRGQIIGITAEAGMGKSRLLAEVVNSSIARGLAIFRGECKSYGASTAYLPWESIWQEFFALDNFHSTAIQIQVLSEWFEETEPNLLPRLPLLGTLLNLPIPDSDLTQAFDAKLRKASLESLLIELVRLRSRTEPMVFVLEDTHWIDPLSQDLLQTLSQSIARQPAAILLAYRPAEEGAQPQQLRTLAHFTEVELSDLPPEIAKEWISLKLSQLYGAGSKSSATFVERLIERAEGNPFYIEEVLNYLKDHEILPEDDKALQELELPASLHSLVLTRIDQLRERPRTTLKVASVVGRSFKAAELRGARPQLEEETNVRADLEVLDRKGFTELEVPVELAYLFKHSVTQEVAYESLPHGTRAGLHENFGQYLEMSYADSLDRHLDLLAYHFDRSRNEPKKREYLRKAGEAAQSNYANSAAIDYYRKLMPLVSPKEQVDVLLREGQVLELLGEWDSAHETLASALEQSVELAIPEGEARSQTAIGELFRKQGVYDDATRHFEEAQANFEDLGDQAGVAQVLHFSGTLAAQSGDYESSTKYYEQSLLIRRELMDLLGTASLLSNLGIVARFQGDFKQAQELNEESLAIRREVGDRWAIANSLNNQGTVFLDQEDYDSAQEKLEEAVSLLREVGDRWHYANAVNNLANVARAQNRYGVARDLYYESLEINRELGDGWALAYLIEDVGYLNAAEGFPKIALKLIGAADSLRESIGAPLPPAERENSEKLLKSARDGLSPEAQDVAFEAGRLLSLEQATEFAESPPTNSPELRVK